MGRMIILNRVLTYSIQLLLVYATLGASNEGGDVFVYSDGSIKGVALGGWLVLEPYITPSLFYRAGNLPGEVPVDEYHYAKVLRDHNETQLLHEHWDSFINETDFEQISDWGLNLVRIPIGYWAFELLDDDPYIQGQEYYLDKAIEWAEDNDLKVWIDLHGVPGSQNGFDNSGLRDKIDWQKNKTNIEVTNDVLEYIFDKYANNTETIIGIEIVNEPFAANLSTYELKDFYLQSYKSLREVSTNNIVIHDAFKLIGYWDNFMQRRTMNLTFSHIVVDHHHYEVFSTSQLNDTIEEHMKNVINYGKSITKEEHRAVVGEWTALLTDCSFWLNGVNRGARFDGTYETNKSIGSCEYIKHYDKWSKTYREDTRKFIELQLYSYSKTAGWIFWTYKTEDIIDWDMQRLIEYDLFPQPLTHYRYNISQFLAESSINDTGSVGISSASVIDISNKWALLLSLLLVVTAIL